MNAEDEIKEISRLIGQWINEIAIHDYNSLYDINKLSEGLSAELLNLVYGYSLVNLNDKTKNAVGIDLGDVTNKVAFQVTSRTDSFKIKKTLKNCMQQRLENTYSNGIKFFLLNIDVVNYKADFKKFYNKFNIEKDIITIEKLINDIRRICVSDIDKGYRIQKLLEKNIEKKEKSQIKPVSINRKKENTPSYLIKINNGHELMPYLVNSDTYSENYDETKNDKEVEMISRFLEDISDYFMIQDDISISTKMKFQVGMNDKIKELNEFGYWIFVAVENYLMEGGVAEVPLNYPVLHISFLRKNNSSIKQVRTDNKL